MGISSCTDGEISNDLAECYVLWLILLGNQFCKSSLVWRSRVRRSFASLASFSPLGNDLVVFYPDQNEDGSIDTSAIVYLIQDNDDV